MKVKWKISAGGRNQQLHIHIPTQTCYKTSPTLIFTGLSVSLHLQNPIRETCSIKSFKKSLWRSTKNISVLEVPSVGFLISLTYWTQVFPHSFSLNSCRHHVQFVQSSNIPHAVKLTFFTLLNLIFFLTCTSVITVAGLCALLLTVPICKSLSSQFPNIHGKSV